MYMYSKGYNNQYHLTLIYKLYKNYTLILMFVLIKSINFDSIKSTTLECSN